MFVLHSFLVAQSDSRTYQPFGLLLWDILDEFIDERDKEMSALVNLINVSKATNCKIKFPYWKLPITSDKSVHPSPYETYLQDTYNNDLNGKPHTTNQPQFSGQFRNQIKLS